MNVKYFVLAALLLCEMGCTAYRDANNRDYSVVSGGFSDRKIEEGIYEIDVASGVSVIINKSRVEHIWEKRAAELCSGGFQKYKFNVEANRNNSVKDTGTQIVIHYYRVYATGYAICKKSPSSYQDAIYIIETPARLLAEKDLKEKSIILEDIKNGCNAASLSIDKLEEIGEVLFRNKLYGEARECFLGVYELEKESPKKINIYQRLGLIYELGLGVNNDMERALYWYKLAEVE